MAQDGQIIWDQKFFQLWHPMVSPNGSKLAAIVAPKYGKWTVAVDGNPWSARFGDLLTDAVFSPDGNRLAAVAKHDEKYMIVVDDKVWKNTFDMAWQPIFSPGSSEVAMKIERNGKYSIAVNDQLWDQECDAIWDPVFSPEGDKILLKTLQGDLYTRRVISIEDILG
jgi:Tol biopolymer transport system component